MKPVILELDDMSDSVQVYDSKPHPFMLYFIYIVFGILLTAFLWMYFRDMEVVVRASGNLKSNVKPISVCVTVNGIIEECHIEEGRYVNKGDVLLKIQDSKTDSTNSAIYTVKADSSGYLYLPEDISVGMYLSEGTMICQIIPKEEQSYYAELHVDNSDIGRLKLNQEVRLEIPSYPSSEYGYFTGVVENISRDIRVDEYTGRTYYLVKVRCEENSIEGKNGRVRNIMNGMACEAGIVTDRKSVLSYVLEMMDFWD